MVITCQRWRAVVIMLTHPFTTGYTRALTQALTPALAPAQAPRDRGRLSVGTLSKFSALLDRLNTRGVGTAFNVFLLRKQNKKNFKNKKLLK